VNATALAVVILAALVLYAGLTGRLDAVLAALQGKAK
jgi:hypothetical protein